MDRNRFSKIGHGDLEYWNPVSRQGLDLALGNLELNQEARVLDVGCGRARILLDLLEESGAQGVGVDPHPDAMDFAHVEALRRGLCERVELKQQDFSAKEFQEHEFDLILCIGSSHAIGTPSEAIEIFADLLKPGGHLLLGEGYWKQTPPADYLEFLGCKEEELLTHQATGQLGIVHNLACISDRETTQEEWDAYEDTYAANLFAFVEATPDDPEALSCSERITAWRNAYLNGGRDTLGFGLYLMQKNEPLSPKE